MLFLVFIVRFFLCGPLAVVARAFARVAMPMPSRSLREAIRLTAQTPPGFVPWREEPERAFLSLR